MPGPVDLLCLQCGLCCNGVIFVDVRREDRSDPSPLFREHGPNVPQPCPAFNAGNCRCAIYTSRPKRCRAFECKQLVAVQAGKQTPTAALKKIHEVRALVKVVEGLLAALGFHRPEWPLNKQFQRCLRAAERGKLAANELDRLADLQAAIHRLNRVLERNFYA